MIYTITFNPAVDYVVYTDELQVGKVNRSKAKRYISAERVLMYLWFLTSLELGQRQWDL